jgi:hypothetical protein
VRLDLQHVSPPPLRVLGELDRCVYGKGERRGDLHALEEPGWHDTPGAAPAEDFADPAIHDSLESIRDLLVAVDYGRPLASSVILAQVLSRSNFTCCESSLVAAMAVLNPQTPA